MRGFISRVLITSLGLWLADVMLSRMSFDDVPSMILSALLLGIVNAFVRPFIVVLTLPITLLSLGIFLLIINGAMVMLVARLMPAFHLEGLGTAVMASIVVGLTSWIANASGPRKRHRNRIVIG
ncbi:MAG: phage holin family protein [Gemmatimonadetes bacterium]|nr:phage holin family protein [Gemmatimonadota bacterium]